MRWLLSTLSVCALFPGQAATVLADDSRAAADVLRAAASSSPRPPECRPTAPGSRLPSYTLWDRARQPSLVRYCDLLARGYARLLFEPGQALAASEKASQLQPGRVAPGLLRASALLGLNRADEAFRLFQAALAAHPELRLSPDGQHAYARAAVASGHLAEALGAYRRLAPMAGLLTATGATECVYIEAAVLIMLIKPNQLQEAVAYLNEARRRNATPALRSYVLAALAFALHRQGRPEEARGVAHEARGRVGLMLASVEAEAPANPSNSELPHLGRLELLPMIGMLTAAENRSLANMYFSQFVQEAPQDHPWLSHVREKLAGKGQ